jgi:hypothetical protein
MTWVLYVCHMCVKSQFCLVSYPKLKHLGFPFHRLCHVPDASPGFCLFSDCAPQPEMIFKPCLRIFFDAFKSRSRTVPHCGQVHSLSFSWRFWLMKLQTLHVLEEGNHLSVLVSYPKLKLLGFMGHRLCWQPDASPCFLTDCAPQPDSTFKDINYHSYCGTSSKKNAKAKTYIPHLKEWVLRPKGQYHKPGIL